MGLACSDASTARGLSRQALLAEDPERSGLAAQRDLLTRLRLRPPRCTSEYPFSLEPEALADRLVVLDRMLARRGRSRREVQLVVCPYLRPADLDLVKRYRDLGVDQWSRTRSQRRPTS
jgi:hypothetical protein